MTHGGARATYGIAIATEAPWPVRNGVTAKSGPLLGALKIPLKVLCPESPNELPQHVEWHQVALKSRGRSRLRDARALTNLELRAFDRLDAQVILNRVREIVEHEGQPRFVHLDTIATAHLIGPIRSLLSRSSMDPAPIVLSINDSYSLLKSTASEASTVASHAQKIYYLGVERKYLPQADFVDVVSPADAHYLNQFVADIKVRTIALGRPSGRLPQDTHALRSGILLFSAAPGLSSFFQEASPILRERLPDVPIRMVGAKPDARLSRLALENGVELSGYVDDLASEVSSARLVIAPSQQVAGTSNKGALAMALGTVVVGGRCLFGIPGFTDSLHGRVGRSGAALGAIASSLYNDDHELNRLRGHARALIDSIPRWDEQAAKYLSPFP